MIYYTDKEKLGPTETRTRINRFRVYCAYHYTIRPPKRFNSKKHTSHVRKNNNKFY